MTATTSIEGLRVASSAGTIQMRVEVISSDGAIVYDSEWQSGNVLDLTMPIVSYGSYALRIHAKDLEGRVAETRTSVRVMPDGIVADPLTVNDVRLTTTAHDGTMGQLITTSGDLSFRFGDYLARRDTEAMRLTREGNLDVKGWIRAGQGIMFGDGSIVTTTGHVPNDRKFIARADSAPVTNQITKYLDTGGTIGDSTVTEVGGKVGIGTTTPGAQLHIFGSSVQDLFAGMGPDVSGNGTGFNFGYAGNSFGVGAGFFNVRPAPGATPPNPSLRFETANVQRMIVTNIGDVGIGTAAPAARLHVIGTQPASVASGDGTNASDVMRIVGGSGGNTTGSGFDFGGRGGSVLIQGGAGGSGVGSAGGSITLQPGAGITAGGLSQPGSVLLAASVGNVGIGTATPALVYKLQVAGDVNIAGTLSKSAGSFKIDHPLDPENKFLYHSFVESPDMKNIYDGVVVLDADGDATVVLPDWFEALNGDFRYQLTCMHGFAPVYIDEEISGNQFKIAGGKSGMKVSWMVTGIRRDSYANAHRIPVEEEKIGAERGHLLYPREH